MKKRKNGWRQLAAGLLSLLLVFAGLPGNALASENIDLDRKASLSLQYQIPSESGQQAASDVAFRLYQVADVSDSLQFTLTGAFADYAVSLEKLDSDDWRSTAQTLAAYAAADQLTPVQQGSTDKNGAVNFADLPVGLYLAVGEKHSQNGGTYLPAPFLICLPNLDEAQGWDYHPAVMAKYSQVTSPGDGPAGSETLEREVVKVWSDGGNSANRPEAITVQLLQDGQVYDTVTLTAADNWRHNWSELSADHVWQVVERHVADGYTVRCASEGDIFVMTNSSSGSTPADSGESGRPAEPTLPEELIGEDDVPKGALDLPDGDAPGGSTTDGSDDYILVPPVEVPLAAIPQTGQLWWPVPLLAVTGLALFLLGWVQQQKAQRIR